MADLVKSFLEKLHDVPTVSMEAELVRCVLQHDFDAGTPRKYLYLSRRRNRCNPEGVACVYCAEETATAEAEHKAQWRGTAREKEPYLVYEVRVRLRRCIDLGNVGVLAALELSETDFRQSWLLMKPPTRLEALGTAIAMQTDVTAIRYPSAACLHAGKSGWNVSIFAESLRPPDRVEILGHEGKVIEVLP